MSRVRRWLLMVALVITTIACDQTTKRFASESFTQAVPYPLVDGTIELLYSENRGAFLGIGAELEPVTRFWLFTVGVTILLLVFAVKLYCARSALELTGWSFVIGGGLGNLIDRVQHGMVIDFLRIGFGDLRTGIFNLADAAIVGGLVLLFLSALAHRPVIARRRPDPA